MDDAAVLPHRLLLAFNYPFPDKNDYIVWKQQEDAWQLPACYLLITRLKLENKCSVFAHGEAGPKERLLH